MLVSISPFLCYSQSLVCKQNEWTLDLRFTGLIAGACHNEAILNPMKSNGTAESSATVGGLTKHSHLEQIFLECEMHKAPRRST